MDSKKSDLMDIILKIVFVLFILSCAVSYTWVIVSAANWDINTLFATVPITLLIILIIIAYSKDD